MLLRFQLCLFNKEHFFAQQWLSIIVNETFRMNFIFFSVFCKYTLLCRHKGILFKHCGILLVHGGLENLFSTHITQALNIKMVQISLFHFSLFRQKEVFRSNFYFLCEKRQTDPKVISIQKQCFIGYTVCWLFTTLDNAIKIYTVNNIKHMKVFSWWRVPNLYYKNQV